MWLIEDDRERYCAVLFEQFSNLIVIKFDSIPPFELVRAVIVRCIEPDRQQSEMTESGTKLMHIFNQPLRFHLFE